MPYKALAITKANKIKSDIIVPKRQQFASVLDEHRRNQALTFVSFYSHCDVLASTTLEAEQHPTICHKNICTYY